MLATILAAVALFVLAGFGGIDPQPGAGQTPRRPSRGWWD